MNVMLYGDLETMMSGTDGRAMMCDTSIILDNHDSRSSHEVYDPFVGTAHRNEVGAGSVEVQMPQYQVPIQHGRLLDVFHKIDSGRPCHHTAIIPAGHRHRQWLQSHLE
jgi:hypothetical protein